MNHPSGLFIQNKLKVCNFKYVDKLFMIMFSGRGVTIQINMEIAYGDDSNFNTLQLLPKKVLPSYLRN